MKAREPLIDERISDLSSIHSTCECTEWEINGLSLKSDQFSHIYANHLKI